MLRRNLSKIGFTIVLDVAENAEERIKKIHHTSYHLILSDIKIPGMSGNDFFEYVKNNVDQAIPIIAMSGTPWLLEKSNFDAIIAKPFRKENLLDMVRQFIQGPEPQ